MDNEQYNQAATDLVNIRHHASELTEQERSTLARTLVSLRRRADSTCEWCGAPISGYASKRWCSGKCRAAERRQRLYREQMTNGTRKMPNRIPADPPAHPNDG
jgi:hypothetical protein